MKRATKKPAVKKEAVDLKNEVEKKQITGLGDVVKTITTALGIPTCEDCEERRLKLNRAFPFLKNVKRDLTEEESKEVLEMEDKKRIPDSLKFVTMFNEIYGTNQKPCNCPALYKDLLSRLVMQVKFQEIK